MALKNYGKLDFNGYVIDVVGVKEECAPTPEVGKQFLQSTFKYDHWQYSDNSHISTTAVIGRKWYPEEGVFRGDKEDGYDSWVWSEMNLVISTCGMKLLTKQTIQQDGLKTLTGTAFKID